MVSGLARALRIHFTRHPLAKVGTSQRAPGTPVELIVQQLEVRPSPECSLPLVRPTAAARSLYWPAGP